MGSRRVRVLCSPIRSRPGIPGRAIPTRQRVSFRSIRRSNSAFISGNPRSGARHLESSVRRSPGWSAPSPVRVTGSNATTRVPSEATSNWAVHRYSQCAGHDKERQGWSGVREVTFCFTQSIGIPDWSLPIGFAPTSSEEGRKSEPDSQRSKKRCLDTSNTLNEQFSERC